MEDDLRFDESVWKRGGRDANKAVHTTTYWMLEVFGGGIVALEFGGWYAFFFVGGMVIAIWIGATAAAPIKQRNEHRIELLALQSSSTTAPLMAADFQCESNHGNWLRIRNLGPGRAFNITIDPVARGPYRCTFESVHVLRDGESADIGGQTEIKGESQSRSTKNIFA